jgi:Na+/phosphate symporter
VNKIVQDVGKTIKWNLEPAVKEVHSWMRRKAKKLHVELPDKAKDLLKQQRHKERMERKWEKRKSKRTEPSMVVDSGATSTCI